MAPERALYFLYFVLPARADLGCQPTQQAGTHATKSDTITTHHHHSTSCVERDYHLRAHLCRDHLQNLLLRSRTTDTQTIERKPCTQPAVCSGARQRSPGRHRDEMSHLTRGATARSAGGRRCFPACDVQLLVLDAVTRTRPQTLAHTFAKGTRKYDTFEAIPRS